MSKLWRSRREQTAAKRLPQILDGDDFDRLLAQPSRTAPTGVGNAAAIAAMYDTGLRVAEVCRERGGTMGLRCPWRGSSADQLDAPCSS
ncbi:MAG TPA: hypothetical protein VGV57_13190 [Thermoleophilaceae bacterium]|nr:hypothetical protein [Thermoleophilaceae bacterium]